MNLNTDAVQNVAWQRMNFESDVVKASGDDCGILSPDIAYSGIVMTVEAGTTIALLDFVGYGNTANAIVLADASDATLPCCGIALEAGVDGDMIKILLYGYLKAADLLFGVQSSGVLTVADNCVDNDTFTIGSTVYEISVDGTITEGNIVAGGVADCHLKAAVGPALVAAINGRTATDGMTAVLTSAFVVTVTATGTDIAATGNAIATTTTADGGDATWGATTMASGTNGGRIFLSDDAGDFALSAGTTIQMLGQALSIREMLFMPSLYMIAS